MYKRNVSPRIAARCVMMALLLLTACQASRRVRPLRFDLPVSLERERSSYAKEVTTALADVRDFFHTSGFEVSNEDLIDSVKVFESSPAAREYFAKEYGAPIESIPETFSGTVEGRTLFLVSREAYREIWRKLYPEWPWSEYNYRQLIVHEVAHRAHEEIAVANYGSADAMGPMWFFEGVAVTCAGQFETDEPPLSREELIEQIGGGHTPKVSYPLYGRIVRSLASAYGMKVLIAGASEPGFPEMLWSLPSKK
jgi:hypothetical protein